MDEKIKKLIKLSQEHIKSSYLFNQTTIAAVVLGGTGQTYTGLNFKYRVRNISMCAERLAIFKALEAGETRLELIVGVKYFPKSDTCEIVSPCGDCRQLEAYYSPIKTIIRNKNVIEVVSIKKLLPHPFL